MRLEESAAYHIARALNLLNIFLLILVGYFDISSIGLEIDSSGLSKDLVFGRESQVKDVGDIVVQHPGEVAMEIRYEG